MNIVDAFKLWRGYSKFEDITKEKISMTLKISQIAALVAQILAMFGVATHVTSWFTAHAIAITIVNAILTVGHSLAPTIIPGAISKANVKAVALLVLLFLMPLCAHGQVSSDGFSATSNAVAVYTDGRWSVGTHIIERYDLMELGAARGTHLYLEGHELVAPTPGFSIFAGGVGIQPDLTALFKHVNAPAGKFNVFLNAAAGNGLPQVGSSHFSWLAGGGVKYQMTSNLTWQTLEAHYGRFGSQGFGSISTGLSFIFGGSSSVAVPIGPVTPTTPQK